MTSPNISTTHAFSTRFGGVSSGIYESMNLAHKTDDDPDNVKENYRILCDTLGIDGFANAQNIACSNQVHGTHIRVVTHRSQTKMNQSFEADGMITDTSGIALFVFTADCVPILLHDPVRNAIGAIHAGWRGTVANIAGIAVKKMQSEFGCDAANIKAAIGPCISKCCYITDKDVMEALNIALPETANIYQSIHENNNENKYLIDLKEANSVQLKNAGVNDIIISNECTSCLSHKYWSHRKTKGKRGSQAAVIELIND
jgi:YfiH family protein